MPSPTLDLIREAAAGSSEGRLQFSQVVGLMVVAGVESYTVDYRSGRATYYPRDGTPLDLALDTPEMPIPAMLDIAALRAAIAGSQRGVVMSVHCVNSPFAMGLPMFLRHAFLASLALRAASCRAMALSMPARMAAVSRSRVVSRKA